MFRYQKRPEFVEAVRVTKQNINEVAAWCGGKVVDGGIEFDAGGEVDLGDCVVKENNEFSTMTHREFELNFVPAPLKTDGTITMNTVMNRG